MSTEIGYGFFPGGDPRRFTPDEECCSPKEIESWEIACAQWDIGNRVVPHSGCTLKDGRFVNLSTFGIGTYQFEIDEADDEQRAPAPVPCYVREEVNPDA